MLLIIHHSGIDRKWLSDLPKYELIFEEQCKKQSINSGGDHFLNPQKQKNY